jgi:UDP-N-acetylglucosamine--N-acetylmuramyl-(pentapeptide) pyrophosphoryl-undecaprenol N-acetylglucosamine transferase
MQAWNILRRERPVGVFSKGGSISVPVCLVARCLRIPIILHESDSVPGVSGAFLARFAKKICTGFEAKEFPERIQKKTIHTGNPVRREILGGNRAAGQRITGFSGRRPVLMVIGGSQGAVALNTMVDTSFDALVDIADIIHLTGTGKETGRVHARYFARPFVHEELAHLYTLADVIVTRAGAGVLSELAALRKAAIVIPLVGVGHDHQVKNARLLAERNAVDYLPQEQIDQVPSRVMALLRDPEKRRRLSENLARTFPPDAAYRIAEVLLDGFRC